MAPSVTRIIPTGIPFAQLPHACNTDPDVTNSAYRVYGFLMKLANSEGRAWPGHRYIADHLPISRPTVQTAIACLEATGWVTVNRTAQAHTYIVHGQLPERLDLDYTDRPGNLTGQETEPGTKVGRTGKETLPEPVKELGLTDNHDKHPDTDNQGRPRDFLWEAFVEVHGEPATESERGKFNAIVARLKKADVTADEYPGLVAAFTTKWNGLQVSPATVAERVGELRHFLERGPIVSAGIDDVLEQRQAAVLLAQQETDDYRLGGNT